ncbi:hypothetical protein MJN76_32965, partial [Salmonella enterica subsp. enterica serovar Anatum]|nr:hypothetical protein [Salmonella enterica subsp. enterica serovar Anatum]
AGCRVIAEGRYNTPALAANAIEHGAWAVTVGSAITRIEHICQYGVSVWHGYRIAREVGSSIIRRMPMPCWKRMPTFLRR